MNAVLEKALERVARLPDAEQESIASLILAELESEQSWGKRLAESQDQLGELVRQARAEVDRGDVLAYDPSNRAGLLISRTTKSFWRHYDNLPPAVQRQAVRAYSLWRDDPAHGSLQFKCVSGKHAAYSIRIGLHWRALSYRESSSAQDVVTWFWIGSHSDYDRLIAGLDS